MAACTVVSAGEQPKPMSYGYTRTPRFDSKAWVAGKDRFPAGAAIIIVTNGEPKNLVPGFFASADPALSFDGQKVLFSGRRSRAERWQIWEVALRGGTPKQLTTGTGNCTKPLYVPDNSIVYTRGTAASAFLEIATPGSLPVRLTYGPSRVLTSDVLRDGRVLFESAADGLRELFTVYPDGTGVESLRCEHGVDRSDARQVASGDVFFSTPGGIARFTPALAKQVRWTAGAGIFGPVAEISNGNTWIAVCRGTTGRFELCLLDASGRRTGVVEREDDADLVEPLALSAPARPRRFPSALVPTRTAGNLLCMDVRVARPELPSAARQVRFFTRTAASESELGTAPVEKDGSFYVQLPANRPLRMELLDSAGAVIRSEHGWFWMKPSEQRVCVGCHAGPERAPENKVPQVLLRSTVPAKLFGTTPEAK